MSADNGIYIAEFPDGFRVIHAQAIDNLWYDPENGQPSEGPAHLPTVKDYFGKAECFATLDEAWKKAQRMYKEIMDSECPILEYGVGEIGKLPKWED